MDRLVEKAHSWICWIVRFSVYHVGLTNSSSFALHFQFSPCHHLLLFTFTDRLALISFWELAGCGVVHQRVPVLFWCCCAGQSWGSVPCDAKGIFFFFFTKFFEKENWKRNDKEQFAYLIILESQALSIKIITCDLLIWWNSSFHPVCAHDHSGNFCAVCERSLRTAFFCGGGVIWWQPCWGIHSTISTYSASAADTVALVTEEAAAQLTGNFRTLLPLSSSSPVPGSSLFFPLLTPRHALDQSPLLAQQSDGSFEFVDPLRG